MSCSVKALPANAQSEVDLENAFVSIVKKGDPKADGRSMPQALVEAWLAKANPKITQSDVVNNFKKLGKSDVTFSEFTEFITSLAQSKGIDLKSLKEQLIKVPPPTVK